MRAAIYARISDDRAGEGLGVERQETLCRELAARKGWDVVQVFVDNDVSAHSRKPRPAYKQMLAAVEAGAIDAILVFKLDRLYRRPIDLEHLIPLVDAKGIALANVDGDVDLSTSSGRLHARIMGAVAANESELKSDRIKAAMAQNAEKGKPTGGFRAFGYLPDRVTIDKEEAALIREAADRVMAGEPLNSIAADFVDRGIPTPTGGQWRRSTLARSLLRPRLAGLREHNGVVVGKAAWPAIFTEEEHEKLKALIYSRPPSRSGPPISYLLSRLLRCGRCGKKMVARPKDGVPRYVCSKDNLGCGRMTIKAKYIEELLTEALFLRLDSPALAGAVANLNGGASNGAEKEILVLQRRAEELALAYSSGHIAMASWATADRDIQDQIEKCQRRLVAAVGVGALTSYVGRAGVLRKKWVGLPVAEKREVLTAVLDHAEIHPADPKVREFDPQRVVPRWKL